MTDLSRDAINRALKAIDDEHRKTLVDDAELIDRLWNEEAPTQTKWDLITGGVNRSKFIKVGGVAVLTSAVLAACGSNDEEEGATGTSAPGSTTPATTGGKVDPMDATIIKFAASVENLAVAAYDMGAPLIQNATLKGVAGLFQAHHKEHAALFNSALKAAGAPEVTTPNQAVLADLKPAIDALKTEKDVLLFAQDLELAAASTYFSTVGVLKGQKLDYTAMTVGGTEYRHAALLSFVNGKPIASTASGFLTTKEAIAPKGV